MEDKIQKDDAAWKKQLTQNQYFVTRKKGTEPPFTGEYEDTETRGTYKCVCCGQPACGIASTPRRWIWMKTKEAPRSDRSALFSCLF